MQFLISVYDKVGSVYFPIQSFENYGDMLRTIRAMASEKQSVFSQYPSDYSVNFVGVFDNGELFYSHSDISEDYRFPTMTFSEITSVLNGIASSQNIDLANVDGITFRNALISYTTPSVSDVDFDKPSVPPIGKDW